MVNAEKCSNLTFDQCLADVPVLFSDAVESLPVYPWSRAETRMGTALSGGETTWFKSLLLEMKLSKVHLTQFLAFTHFTEKNLAWSGLSNNSEYSTWC